MGLQFIFGGSGSGKSKTIYSEVLKQAKENLHTNYYVIVPDQFTMQTQKDLCNMSESGGIMNIDVLSFKRLSYRVLEEVGKNTIPVLDDTGKSLLLRNVAKKEMSHLPTIGGNINKTGYIHEVKSVISEFMQYGIDSEKLDTIIAASEKNPALQLKLIDLKRIYQSFLALIDESFITKEEELVLVKEVIKESKIVRDSVIIFDGFTGFTPVQNQLIQEIMRYTKEIIVTVLFDTRKNPYGNFTEQDLYYLSYKMIKSLTTLAKDAGIPKREDLFLKENYRHEENVELAFLEKNLFRYGRTTYEKETENICLIETMSVQDEIHYILEEISRLVQEEGMHYRDIAVITGGLNSYAHLLEANFEQYQIPYFLDLTQGIVLNPCIEYIKSALEIINNGYTHETIFHFLRSGLLPIERSTVDKLDNYVRALGIRGIRTWENPFYKTTRDFGKNTGKELEEINSARKIFVELLAPFHKRTKTVADKIQILYQFILDSDLERYLWERSDWFEERGENGKTSEYRQIYRMVMDLLNQIMELMGDEAISWKDFSEILFAGFDEIQVATIPQNRDSVLVGDMKRTRLKEMKVLFFIGVNDGIIPQISSGGGILSDIERDFIDQASFELSPTARQKMFEQRLYLYMNMSKPTKYLYLSYAGVDAEGKTLRPSYLIHVIENLFPKVKKIFTKRMDERERLYAGSAGKDYFISKLREYALLGANASYADKKVLGELISLYQYMKEEFDQEIVEKMVDAAFYQYQENPLSKEIARELYGKILVNSVSRLEKYAGCAYAHFLEYGLKLAEREEFTLEARDTGTILHGVLEEFSKELEHSKYSWFDFPTDLGNEMIDRALERYAHEYGEQILFDSSKNEYQIKRLKRVLRRSIWALQHQVKEGLFKPTDFEVSFAMYEDLESLHIKLSEEEEMHLRGRIDRVDVKEEEDRVYVKVMDYKSGNSKFDIASLYYGLQLQLVMYMNVAIEREKMRHKDKEIIPSGMFYYHVKDPFVDTKGKAMTEAAIQDALIKELRMNGVASSDTESLRILDHSGKQKSDVFQLEYKKDGSISKKSAVMEPEQMQMISSFVNKKIKTMGSEILRGDIGINPYHMEQKSSCTYCEFQSICKINSRLSGYQTRELEKIDEESAFQLIKEELGGEN